LADPYFLNPDFWKKYMKRRVEVMYFGAMGSSFSICTGRGFEDSVVVSGNSSGVPDAPGNSCRGSHAGVFFKIPIIAASKNNIQGRFRTSQDILNKICDRSYLNYTPFRG